MSAVKTLRLYFNKKSLSEPVPKWALYLEETGETFYVDRVVSTGVSHETESGEKLPGLNGYHVLKYTNVAMTIVSGNAFLTPIKAANGY